MTLQKDFEMVREKGCSNSSRWLQPSEEGDEVTEESEEWRQNRLASLHYIHKRVTLNKGRTHCLFLWTNRYKCSQCCLSIFESQFPNCPTRVQWKTIFVCLQFLAQEIVCLERKFDFPVLDCSSLLAVTSPRTNAPERKTSTSIQLGRKILSIRQSP